MPCCPAAEFPMKLYKYFDRNGWKSIGSGHPDGASCSLFAKHPREFNDPFEWHSPPSLEITKHLFSEHLSSLYQRDGLDKVLQVMEEIGVPPDFPTEHLVDHLSRKAIEHYETSPLPEFLVVCFSMDPANLLMWSHYGQSHKGLVIGYDSSTLQSDPECFHPVNYAHAPAQFGVCHTGLGELSRESIEGMKRNHFTKHIQWSYENEVRILLNPKDSWREASGTRLLEFSATAIDEVIFGIHASPKTICRTKQALVKAGQAGKVRLRKAHKHTTQYRIEFEDLFW
jgi:Protein of unknown function (DUF2971)